jgi:leader peptidase (prepilin peptidase) / N-methyltransferase
MMIRTLATIFAGLLGLAFGSFLNVCVSRWPQGESIVSPRSHCRSCGRMLKWWENVPLLSWIALRGRCRTCGVWIGLRYPIVELSVGVVWAYICWRLLGGLLADGSGGARLSFESATLLVALDWVLIWLAALDFEHYWIPDVITVPCIVLGVLFDVLFEGSFGWTFVLSRIRWTVIGERLLGVLAAAALILLIRWLYWLIRRREGIGLGDAKLMAMLAAWLGLQGALVAFALGVTLGALTALAVLIAKPQNRQEGGWATMKAPLGTFLCIGGIVSGLWGTRIIDAYMRWAGF